MPMHRKQTWKLVPVASAERLAERLVNHAWTLCSGWSPGGYDFPNDATSEDGAFEVAVVKPPSGPVGEWWQIESITFSWLGYDLKDGETELSRAVGHINRCLSGAIDPGEPDGVAWKIEALDVESPDQHGRCPSCA